MCLQDVGTGIAFEMVERLLVGIAAMAININQDKNIQISTSFGIAPLEADTPVEHSIEQADKAMYQAKLTGRNCTQIFSK